MMNPRPDRCMSIRSDIFDRDKDTTLDNCIEEVGRISAGTLERIATPSYSQQS